MFKRVDRRLKRKAEHEELGIDSDLKEALGIPDTDSDESDSSDDGSGSGEEDEDEEIIGDEEDANDSEDAHADGADVEDEGEALSDADDDSEEDRTVAQVLQNVLYPSAANSEITKCSVCPGKSLTTSTNLSQHLTSQHHTRRFTQFIQNTKSCEDRAQPVSQYLPRKQVGGTAPQDGPSKREQKKLQRRAFHARKRNEKKAAYAVRKANRETTITDADSKAKTSNHPDKPKKITKPKPKTESKVKAKVKVDNVAPPKKKQKTEKMKS